MKKSSLDNFLERRRSFGAHGPLIRGSYKGVSSEDLRITPENHSTAPGNQWLEDEPSPAILRHSLNLDPRTGRRAKKQLTNATNTATATPTLPDKNSNSKVKRGHHKARSMVFNFSGGSKGGNHDAVVSQKQSFLERNKKVAMHLRRKRGGLNGHEQSQNELVDSSNAKIYGKSQIILIFGF